MKVILNFVRNKLRMPKKKKENKKLEIDDSISNLDEFIDTRTKQFLEELEKAEIDETLEDINIEQVQDYNKMIDENIKMLEELNEEKLKKSKRFRIKKNKNKGD